MTLAEHAVFYYPYADLSDRQIPLLKAAALYFDRMYLLDPEKASRSDGDIGVEDSVAADVRLLENEGLLVRIRPEEVLTEAGELIAAAVREDLADQQFLDACARSARKRGWLIALAKIPESLRDDPDLLARDAAMRRLMGDLPRSLDSAAPVPGDDRYFETRLVDGQSVEFRYANFSLPLGESIIVNHALYGGFLHAHATPLTDDEFHAEILRIKLARALRAPEMRDLMKARQTRVDVKASDLALSALTDIDLAIIPPALRVDQVLEFRLTHRPELEAAREELRQLAAEIETNLGDVNWPEAIAAKVSRLQAKLADCHKARDSWLSGRVDMALAGIGVIAGAAALTMAPISLASIPDAIGTAAVPALALWRQWRASRRDGAAHGLQYFLNVGREGASAGH